MLPAIQQENRTLTTQAPPVSSVKRRHSATRYRLVMCITAEHKSISIILRNTITLFHSLQKRFSFKGVVFTTSPSLIRFAQSMNVDVITSFETNPYHLPFVNKLLITISKHYSSSYYGYINSDILINYRIFAGLDIIDQAVQTGQIHTPLEIASTTMNIPSVDLTKQLRYSANLGPTLRKYQKQSPPRSTACSDVFIFSADWPFEEIPPFVVGRRWIDYGLNAMAVKYRFPFIDISKWAYNIHQGFDSYRKRVTITRHKDYYWNIDHYLKLGKANLESADWKLCARMNSLQRRCTVKPPLQ